MNVNAFLFCYLCTSNNYIYLFSDMNIASQSPFILPAEWYPQHAVMLTWPHENTDWKPYLQDITHTYLLLTQAITRHEQVVIVTPEPDHVSELLKDFLSEAEFARVSVYDIESNDTWARDHGPITLINNDQPSDHLLLDFKFNGWGDKFASEKDNAINQHLYKKGGLNGNMEDHTDFVLEGGSIESDGRGTIFTTSTCLLAPHRNQPLTREEIAQHLCNYLRADRVVWLDYGNLIGDDTDGHIDTIVRIAPDDTLLYVGAGNPDDEQHEDFVNLEQQLQQLTTTEGKPYRLLRLPMPDAIYDDDERLPATYANYLIINGAVIYPTYAQPVHDEEARKVLAQAFPDRELIGIDANTIIRQHGSIHCLTMQLL